PDIQLFANSPPFFGNNPLELSGPITGPASSTLEVQGGTVKLSNSASSFSGSLLVEQGTLQVGALNAIPAGCAVTVNAGATMDLNRTNDRIGSLAGVGNVILSGTLLTGGNNQSTTFSGTFSSIGNLVKEGTGIFTLGASGALTPTEVGIDGGTLRLGAN